MSYEFSETKSQGHLKGFAIMKNIAVYRLQDLSGHSPSSSTNRSTQEINQISKISLGVLLLSSQRNLTILTQAGPEWMYPCGLHPSY